MKKILLLLLLFSLAPAFALNCSACKKTIKGKYLKDKNGTSFCSEKCFASTAPKCTRCKKPCIRGEGLLTMHALFDIINAKYHKEKANVQNR